MKNKKSKFEQLFQEAIEGNIFGDETTGDESPDTGFENFDNEGLDKTDDVGEDVTITLTSDQVSVLKDILSQLDTGEGEEELEEIDDTDIDDGIEDIEELEREAVEFEKAPNAESVKNSTKKGTVVDQRGDLEKETSTQDGEEKQYKFVKKTKPTELKHKTTKGS